MNAVIRRHGEPFFGRGDPGSDSASCPRLETLHNPWIFRTGVICSTGTNVRETDVFLMEGRNTWQCRFSSRSAVKKYASQPSGSVRSFVVVVDCIGGLTRDVRIGSVGSRLSYSNRQDFFLVGNTGQHVFPIGTSPSISRWAACVSDPRASVTGTRIMRANSANMLPSLHTGC